MDAKLLAKIALRVLGVYFIAESILALPELIGALLHIGDTHNTDMSPLWFSIAVLSIFTVGLGLWYIAPRAAGWMVGKSGQTELSIGVSAEDLLAVALASIGIIFVMQSLPHILGLIYESMTPPLSGNASSIFYSDYFFAHIARLILGLVLIIGTKSLVRLFRGFREFGLKE